MNNRKKSLINQKQTEIITPYVRDFPFNDFGDWFRDILDSVKPSLTMSIARGALRFLQLCDASGSLKDTRYVSNHVIPFMRDDELADRNILLFDDSVIYGSTMDSIKNHLECRGASVSCSTYVVDRKTFYGEIRNGDNDFVAPSPYCNIPLHTKYKLWPDEIRQHHVRLVQSILKTPLHYNLDFPTILIQIENCSPQDTSYFSYLMQNISAFRCFADVSAPISNQCGIVRYSALMKPQRWNYLNNEYIKFRKYNKIRITFAAESNLVLITPIVQLAIDKNACYENIRFSSREANDLWRTLYGPREQNNESSKHALFRLTTAFAGIILGASIY